MNRLVRAQRIEYREPDSAEGYGVVKRAWFVVPGGAGEVVRAVYRDGLRLIEGYNAMPNKYEFNVDYNFPWFVRLSTWERDDRVWIELEYDSTEYS